MNLLTTLLFVGDPLLIAFMVSIIIGATSTYKRDRIMLKYALSGVAFLLYFSLYAYGVLILRGIIAYVIMFAPWVLFVAVIIVSIIVTPKGKIIEDSKGDYGFTGYDTMFPNDIDSYDKHKK